MEHTMEKIKLKIIIWLIGPIPEFINDLVEQSYQEIWPKHDSYEKDTKRTLFWTILKAYFIGRKEKMKNVKPPEKPFATGAKGKVLIFDDILKEQIKNMD